MRRKCPKFKSNFHFPNQDLDLLKLLNPLLLITSLPLIHPRQSRQPMLLRIGIHTNRTTIPPHLCLLMLDIRQRPLTRDGIFIRKDEDI